jgi:hypothetical protein
VAAERERDRDGGVDVGARQVPDRVDHHHDDQPEHEADPDGSERPSYSLLATTAPQPAKTRAKAANPSAAERRPRSGPASSTVLAVVVAIGPCVASGAIVSIDNGQLNRYM